jgi:DNA (cytosine-5)-methyltransferase 1
VFLLENVPGLAFSGKSDGLELIRKEIAAINARQGSSYKISVACLNAADFGVPQLRHRVFVVGHREGKAFKFPAPTHGPADELLGNQQPYATAWDALGNLPELNRDPELSLSGKWADLLPSIPEGQNYLWHTPRGGGSPLFGWRTRYWNFLLKLSRTLPAWTLQAQPGPATGPFHWTNRKLSARELMRLQTIPDDVTLPCSRTDAQRLVGNAVPSALAELLAHELRRQYFGGGAPSEFALLPTRRTHAPPPWPLSNVPPQYRSLEGPHSDHPGTGKGNRAAARQSAFT